MDSSEMSLNSNANRYNNRLTQGIYFILYYKPGLNFGEWPPMSKKRSFQHLLISYISDNHNPPKSVRCLKILPFKSLNPRVADFMD